MSCGEAIKDLRLELGLTQEDLAKRIGKAFVTVNRWENNKTVPSRKNAEAIIKAAQTGCATDDCIDRLYSELLPSVKRIAPAKEYGFPDIDRNFLFRLSDDSVNAIYVVDALTYKLIYINRKAEEIAAARLCDLGMNIKSRMFSEQKNKLCYHFFSNSNTPCSYCPINKLSRKDYRDSIISFASYGKTYKMNAKISKLQKRDVYVIYLTDVTESHAELNSLYEMTNDIPIGAGIYAVYPDCRTELEYMNTVLLQMIGEKRRKALINNKLSDYSLIHPKDKPRLIAKIKEAAAGNLNTEIDLRMQIRDGRYYLIRVSARLLKKDSKKATYYCLFREIKDEPDAGSHCAGCDEAKTKA